MTDAELFCAIGAALYGPLWMNALARAYGINERTVRRWAMGRMPIPRGVFEKLESALEARAANLLGELRSRTRSGSTSAPG